MTPDNRLITGFVAGALVGIAAALLLAPNAGSETRSMIASRAGDLRRRAGELRERAGTYVSNLRDRGGDAGDDLADAELDRPVSG